MDSRLRHFFFVLPLALLISIRADALELNGVAPFSELGNEIFLAALYVDSRTSDTGQLFSSARERKMEIRFSSSMSRRRWSTNWMQSIAINASRDALTASADELSEILSAFADNLSHGDRVEFHYVPEAGTHIRINGTTLARGKSSEVFNLFLAAWIGSVPPTSGFRNALLGREPSTAEQDRFYLLEPSAARMAAVRPWAIDEPEAEPVAEPEPVVEAEPPPPPEVEPPPTPVVETPVAPVEEPAAEPVVEIEPAPEEAVAQPAPEPEPAPVPPAPEPAVAAVDELEDEGEVDLSVEAILAQQEYATNLIRKIYGQVQYPSVAVRRNQEGSVRMRLTLNTNGSIASLTMVEEAPHGSLNTAAERAIVSAAPFDPPPASLGNSGFEIEIPIAFRLTSD